MNVETHAPSREVLDANRQALNEMAENLEPGELSTLKELENEHTSDESAAKREAAAADHQALVEMQSTLSDKDRGAFNELVDYNRDTVKSTRIEIKHADTGKESVAVHQSVGDRALGSYANPYGVVHAATWVNQEQHK